MAKENINIDKRKALTPMKVILYMAISADGFIAGPHDETPWSDDEWDAYAEFVRSVGNIVVGRRTFEIMKKENEFDRIGNPFTAVVTTDSKRQSGVNTVFVNSPEAAVAIIRDKGFRKLLLGGGGNLNASFLRAGLIDEIVLDQEPVILGGGIKLFDDTSISPRLTLLNEIKITPRLVRRKYTVNKMQL